MELVTFYFDQNSREYKLPQLDISKYSSIEEAVSIYRDTISRSIVLALTDLLKYQEVPTFLIKQNNLIFCITRKEAEYSIQQVLPYFIEIEDYETCQFLITLQKQLYEKNQNI